MNSKKGSVFAKLLGIVMICTITTSIIIHLSIPDSTDTNEDLATITNYDTIEKDANIVLSKPRKRSNSQNDKISTTSAATPATVTTEGSAIETKENKFAYAFLIAGCDPKVPNYRGYIYNVIIAKYLFFKEFKTSTDVIVMIRMHANSPLETLPKEDEDLLTKVGIIVKYLPKPLIDNFHTAMMDKFRILELTTYDRVIYLDSDVIPLNNLDYMFELSVGENAKLEENVAMAYNTEPSSGGFFMLSPKDGDYDEISAIIEKREREGYHFNETIGWGHEMIPPDGWESLLGPMGTKWDFYGAFTDQGLIYYWTKYVKKRVSFIGGYRVKHWRANDQGEVQLVKDEAGVDVFGNIPKTLKVRTNHHSRFPGPLSSIIPFRDFHHFKSFHKPWFNLKKKKIDHGQHEFWFETLHKVNKEYKLGIDVDNVGFKKPSLGLFPAHIMIENTKEARQKNDLLISKSSEK